ncbi:hypothetical protein WJX84_002095 [Apatococcus fuscideae]|uniref:BP28 C-terminal domain-containing protein n=1 Tax=Apatococcus fuscideae TaxID=2026836 RepID=A0AAW1TDV1_9CHLO
MATALAEQLQQLTTRFGDAASSQKVGKASLLFSPREAADIDLQTIYNIGLAGFEELCTINQNFKPFASTLFGRAGLTYDVDQHTIAELERLDISLVAFLQVLSDHFLLNGAIKALEFLIRRFRIHQRNVDALMACVLPYHGTNEFVRLMQLMQIAGTQWAFLQPMQQSGAALPRGILVQRCHSDKAVLAFICSLASQLSESGRRSPVQLSFYAVTVCEVLAFGPEVHADTIGVLLPNLVQGLSTGASKDFQLATHMILAQLCSRAVLSPALLKGLVPSLMQQGCSVGLQQRLMLVAHICATQPIPSDLETNIVQGFTTEAGLGEVFARLSPSHSSIKALAAKFLQASNAIEGAEGEAAATQHMQEQLIRTAVLGSAVPAGVPASITKDLSSSNPSMRVKGVQRLEECKGDAQAAASRTLLRFLTDPEADVLTAVLASPSLRLVSPEALYEALQSCLQAAWAQLSSGSKPRRRAAELTAKKVLAYLGKTFLESHPSFRHQASFGVANCLIALPGSTDRTAARALQMASTSQEALFAGFGKVQLASHGGKAGAKKRSAEECHEANNAVVEALSIGWAKRSTSKCLDEFEEAGSSLRLLLLLALRQAALHGKDKQAQAAATLLRAAMQLLSSKFPGGVESIPDDHTATLKDSVPTAAFWELYATQPAGAARAAASQGLLTALAHATPADILQGLGGDDGDAKRALSGLSRLQPAADFKLHTLLLWKRACQDEGHVLTDMLNSSDASSQEQALVILTSMTEKKLAATPSASMSARLFPATLAALSSPSKATREQALEFCQAASAHSAAAIALLGDGASLSEEVFGALVKSLLEHATAVEADPSAAAALFQQAHHLGGKKKGGSRGLAMPAAALASVTDYLLECLVANGSSELGSSVPLFICQCLPKSTPPAASLTAAHKVLQQLLSTPAVPSGPSNERLCQHLVALYTPQALQACTSGSKGDSMAPGIMRPFIQAAGLTISSQSPSHWRALHMAVLGSTNAESCTTIPANLQQELLMACLRAYGADQLPECKAAARSALEAMAVTAQPLTAVLRAPGSLPGHEPPAATPSTAGKRLKLAPAGVAASPGPVNQETLVAVLELLQWRQGILEEHTLAQPLSALLGRLLDIATQASSGAPGAVDGQGPDAVGQSAAHTAEASFLAQLVLSALRALSERADAVLLVKGMDMGVVIRCTCLPSQPAAQQAALKLLTHLAAHLPHASLATIINGVLEAATEQGGGAMETASAALASLGPTWLAAGQPVHGLLALLTSSLASMQPLQRLPLLSATLQGLPQEEGLAAALHQLLGSSASQLAAPQSPSTSPAKTSAPAWAQSLSHAICNQVEESIRLRALATFMEQQSAEIAPSDHATLVTVISFMLAQIKTIVRLRRSGSSSSIETSLAAILQHTLSHLQAVGTSSKKRAKRCREVLLELVTALQQVMPPSVFLTSLIGLACTAPDRIACKALRLITSSLPKLSPSQVDTSTGHKPDTEQAGEAAQQLCELVQASFSPGSSEGGEQQPAATRQALLVALGTLARTCQGQHAQPLLACIPSLLHLVAQEPRQAVRSSAMACLAAIVTGLAMAALPALPKLVPVLLDATEKAVLGLGVPAKAALGDADMAEARAKESDEEDASPAEGGDTWHSESEGQGSLRREGEDSAVALLTMLQTATESMPTAVAAEHAAAIFELLMQALNCRQQQPAAMRDVGRVESQAVKATVAATMKLSEGRFKPLFLRLLEWASVPSSSQPDASSLGRQTALFSVVIALTRRLRAVFVPYFRYLMDVAVVHLGGSMAATGDEAEKPKKKKKRQQAGVAAADGSSPDGSLLCFRVMAALRHCFQHDSVEFVDEARFSRLLPLLVSQLGGGGSPDPISAAEAEAQDCSRDESQGDRLAGAAVEALVCMAAAVKDQALWQTFNRQVLMATRSRDAKQKQRALKVISGFLGRAQEEYLVLLPESLPFLAELLEDPELGVSSLAQEILRQLEEISGESLDQYLS